MKEKQTTKVTQQEDSQTKKVFAQGLCFYKLVWVFAITCLIGYGIEEIWCLIRHGYFESRQALVYGPLSVIYGMGAVVITLALYKIRNSKWYTIFIVSFLVGSFVEYIASLGQEIFFGSVAWDYSNVPLNINGRVCVPYSLFWGLIGLVWIKWIYPFFSKLIEKIPYHYGVLITWSFIIFFIYDCFMSAAAGSRMAQRANDVPAKNYLDHYLDKHFTDERMHKIYANSKSV